MIFFSYCELVDEAFGILSSYDIKPYFTVRLCSETGYESFYHEINGMGDLHALGQSIGNGYTIWIDLVPTSEFVNDVESPVGTYNDVNMFSRIAGALEEIYEIGALKEYTLE